MVSAFPTPVLSVTADAVRDLEGRDALSGLWTLFTKCKESLQDGRRLENISWRLWYREMMLENHSRESVPLVHNLDCPEEEKAVEEVEQPIAIAIVDQIYTHQPSDSVAIPPPYSPHQPQTGASVPNATSSSQGLVSSDIALSPTQSRSSLSPSPSPLLSRSIPEDACRPSLSRTRRGSFLNGHPGPPVSVGKIICDMLPSSCSSSSASSSSGSSKAGIATLNISRPNFSRNSTSSNSSSSSSAALEVEVESNQEPTTQAGSLRLDPTIQMTPIAPSISPPSSTDGYLPMWAIPGPPSVAMTQNVVPCLLTPEMEVPEPESHIVVVAPANSATHLTSVLPSSSSSAASSSTIPASSSSTIPTSITSTTTSADTLLPNVSNAVESSDPAQVPTTSTSVSGAKPAYAGPPSPSLSDSYARSHPGEAEAKEVGLEPSFSRIGGDNNLLLQDGTSTISVPQVQEEQFVIIQISSFSMQYPITPQPVFLQQEQQPGQPQPPRLVVVNPTPNPTPHPTPPATPVLFGTAGGAIRSQWLTLPGADDSVRARHRQQHQQLQLHNLLPPLTLPPPSGSANADATMIDADASVQNDRLRSDSSGTLESSAKSAASVIPDSVSSDLATARHVPPRLADMGDQLPAVSAGASIGEKSITSPKHIESRQLLEYEDKDPQQQRSNRHSISSTTSQLSHTTTASDRSSTTSVTTSATMGSTKSTTTRTTVSDGEEPHTTVVPSPKPGSDLVSTLLDGYAGGYTGAMGVGLGLNRVESLSTIQSLSTLVGHRKETGGAVREVDDEVRITVVSDQDVEEAVDEEDDSPLSPLPSEVVMSPRSEKKKKRNSAPSRITSSASLLARSPPMTSNSNAGQPLSANSASSTQSAATSSALPPLKRTGSTKRRTAAPPPTSVMARRPSSTRSTSRSRSTGRSSAGKSRSRSREPGIGMAGLGLGMTAAPTTTTARKAPVIGAGRGRAKFVLGRTSSKKSNIAAMRRHSSSTAVAQVGEAEAEVMEQELQREETEKEERERMSLAAAEQERERVLRQQEDMRRQEQARKAIAVQEERKREEEERQRQQRQREALAALNGNEAGSSRRLARFNIGSNSDDGSGIGSKSGGSGSDVSGGHNRGGVDGRATSPSNGKGKERARDELQVEPQQYQQHTQQQQQHLPQLTGQLMQHHRQLSKQQLHQLQKMEQLHQQHQNRTTTHPQNLQHQHQQQFPQRPEQLQKSSRQPSTKQLDRENVLKNQETVVVDNTKGKQKEAALALPAAPDAKSKKSNSTADVGPTAADEDMMAKVKQSLHAPWLPKGNKHIVLATSESDFETDDDDDASWSSEDMTGQEAEQQAIQEELRHPQQLQQDQHLLLQQQQIQQQRQRQQQQQQHQIQQQLQQVRPPGVQRTHSSHYPAPNNGRGKQAARAQQQRQAQANTQALMERAVYEAQRQREMFAKLPTPSFQDLANARTRSVGLLTQLMNPNPEIFPVNHPYRRGSSSGEIHPGGITSMAPMQPLTSIAAPRVPPSNAPAPVDGGPGGSRPAPTRRRSADIDSNRKPPASRTTFSPPLRAAGMQLTKSAAALPMSTQIQVGSVSTQAAPVIDHTSAMMTHVNINGGGSGGYRPKGPPKDQELEDDSGSEAEPGGGIQVSQSVAQQKLKALAERRGIVPNAHRAVDNGVGRPHPQAGPSGAGDDDDVPHWAMVSQPQQQHNRSQSQGQPQSYRRPPTGLHFTPVAPHDPSPPPSAAIPLGYPYNLPPPEAPSTPRTTRRHMLATEMPESLRRNLLWERQVSKVNLAAVRRSASGGGSRHSVLGGLQPLTAAPSMVQLHAKGTKPDGSSHNGFGERRPAAVDDKEKQDKKRKAMARNKSWADDYHYSGW